MTQPLAAGSPAKFGGIVVRPLLIGLVNGMPGESGTERQFRSILGAAAGQPVELRIIALEQFAAASADGAACRYDGLIVTGMPPRAGPLREEPHWHSLTKLVDFAMRHGVPTVWSCLAAHAAVLYLDGIERRRMPQKLSGLIECMRTDVEEPLVSGLPTRWQVPHSRYNDVPEDALCAHGYRILSRAPAIGADLFAKDVGAPFLFCHGHPEYEPDTLLREYRRDIRQFLSGERADYPAVPERMFGPSVLAQLEAFRARALGVGGVELLAEFPWEACVAGLGHPWQKLTVALFRNWLSCLEERAMVAPRVRHLPVAPDAALTRGAADWSRASHQRGLENANVGS